MALKNLFDMVKADRYTQDGREEIIKAQEEETEDKVYQIGEISQKTGLQKTANGWVKPKKDAAGKTSRASKEEAIRKDLGLTAGEDMSRFSDEQIEKMYAKTQQTPEQQKADFDKSKIGHAVNKGRQEFAAEKTRQKELASKTNAIGLLKENKTTIRQGPKTKTLNETPAEHVQKNLDAYKGYQPYDMEELVLKPSGYEKQTSARVPGGGQSITYTKNGAEDITLFFDKNGELENADVAGSKPAEESVHREQTPEEIREIGRAGREWRESQKRDAEERQKEVQKALAEQMKKEANSSEVKIRGMNKNQYIFNTMMERHIPKEKAEESWNQEVERVNRLRAEASDSAPRALTGDTRIRVRKA